MRSSVAFQDPGGSSCSRVASSSVCIVRPDPEPPLTPSHPGKDAFALDVFERATWLDLIPAPARLSPYLENSLDRGEAAVIQSALDRHLDLVCIDEIQVVASPGSLACD